MIKQESIKARAFLSMKAKKLNSEELSPDPANSGQVDVYGWNTVRQQKPQSHVTTIEDGTVTIHCTTDGRQIEQIAFADKRNPGEHHGTCHT